jgi:sugar phosphate isomerase/epimerase
MTRKTFLKLSGNLTAAALAVGSLPAISSCARASTSAPDPAFGLQLYSLRDAMPADPRGVLRQVAEFGYKHIESYEGPMGMFWGMSPANFKSYMDDLGTKLIASHCNINENFEQKAADAASIGMEYLICPWIGPQSSLDAYKLFADQFNRCGEICNANGIKFAYHNHAYTFELLEGVYPQDLLMAQTDPTLVEYELDIFWLAVAGLDPATWLQKYPGRFTLSHIKDRETGTQIGNGDSSTTLGIGDIDYPTIIKVAQENGMKHLIVEQEKYAGTTPLDSARENALFMKNLLRS